MSNNRKSREDYGEPIRCSDCGRETGPFYMDTDDDDILCLDCLLGLPEEDELLFRQALDSSSNWEQASNRNGLILLRCVHCSEVVHTFDGGDWYGATEVLEADVPHEGNFTQGDRVLHTPTGQWGTVEMAACDECEIRLDGDSGGTRFQTTDLIAEEDVEGEGEEEDYRV